MHIPHLSVDVGSISSVFVIASTFASFIVAIYHQKIFRGIRLFLATFSKTSDLVVKNQQLTEELASAEQRSVEWAAAFENVDNLRIAIGEQLERLTEEIADIRKRLSVKDDLIGILKSDRDGLLTWGRLLVGQLHAAGTAPDYPAPSLKSITAMPGPAMPEDQHRL